MQTSVSLTIQLILTTWRINMNWFQKIVDRLVFGGDYALSRALVKKADKQVQDKLVTKDKYLKECHEKLREQGDELRNLRWSVNHYRGAMESAQDSRNHWYAKHEKVSDELFEAKKTIEGYRQWMKF